MRKHLKGKYMTENDGTIAAEQPKITGQEKFRRGGFKPAAEVLAEAEVTVPPDAQVADPEMQAAILADETVGIEVGEGVSLGGTEISAPEEGEVPQAEEATTEAPKFKIGAREFTNQEEAWAYAEQIEQERIAADAFRQGVEAASRLSPGNPAPQPQKAEVPEEIDPLYYTDPQAYFAKREAQIIARATQAVDQQTRQRQTHEETWNQFYSEYPDLATAKEFVDLTLQQNWTTLQHVETKQALKQLAEKTRAKLKPIIEARIPKTELPKVKTAVSAGGSQQVTQKKTEYRPLSFVEQQRNIKKSRTQVR